MRFEVVNSRGAVVMSCASVSCIPPDSQLKSMEEYDHKFRLDGKNITRRKIRELREKSEGDEENASS